MPPSAIAQYIEKSKIEFDLIIIKTISVKGGFCKWNLFYSSGQAHTNSFYW